MERADLILKQLLLSDLLPSSIDKRSAATLSRFEPRGSGDDCLSKTACRSVAGAMDGQVASKPVKESRNIFDTVRPAAWMTKKPWQLML